ncbi:alpha/beta-hydrolase [Hysterangium stoloniferum]|nr:alpha/beta-hydrolase [Hysterangium stoloniferum]
MIDHLLGRPSASWKRKQVFFVILFWIWRFKQDRGKETRLSWIRRINHACCTINATVKQARLTPWQIAIGVFTMIYAGNNLDSILGLDCELLCKFYSRSYYRATWIVTGLDAGFATAMSIQPKWLRDISSILFSIYYIIYANKGEEMLRRYRAVCTVEMLRTTWEKTTNPYIRIFNAFDRPSIPTLKRIILPRRPGSSFRKPVVGWLFFNGSESQLSKATDLIFDIPGGGFICMTPKHHEERLRRWTIRCKRPVFSIEYSKAPEYPFPYAIEECFEAYHTVVDTKGRCVGMSGSKLSILMSGDSAGANIVASVMFKILEYPEPISRPIALVLAYAALDFNFTSWMSPANLRVLRAEHPLAVVNDTSANLRRRKSWRRILNSGNSKLAVGMVSSTSASRVVPHSLFKRKSNPFAVAMGDADDAGNVADEEDIEEPDLNLVIPEQDKPIAKRVMISEDERHEQQRRLSEAVNEANAEVQNVKKAPIGTRLTMTSRSGYFQDRIISPTMMRAMAILYIGPEQIPDFETNYYLSPILGPNHLLAQFPPMLMSCGEKDPFVDDTVIFAGRVRKAKRLRKVELEAPHQRTNQNMRRSESDERLLNETDEDWVRLAIIEGWSHGFLQMSTLMPEAREAINEIGDWINNAFMVRTNATYLGRKPNGEGVGGEVAGSSETETDEGLMFVPKRKRVSIATLPRYEEGEELSPATRTSDETLVEERTTVPNKSVGDIVPGKVAILVSEADLLQRRREEAVFGIGDVRSVEYPRSASG